MDLRKVSQMSKLPRRFGLHHLHYFVVSAENGSFRQAARELEIQESAVSRRVRDLEDQVGASLFHRHSAGVTLTFAGETFLKAARNILGNVEETITDICAAGRGEKGRLTIGIFSSLASGFLNNLIVSFGRSFPEIEIELVNGNPTDHFGAIRSLRLDIAFVSESKSWPDCDNEELWKERVFLVCPEHHELAAGRMSTWDEIADETFLVSEVAPGQEMRDYLVRRLASVSRAPRIQTHAVGRDNLHALVAMGRGLAVTREASTATQFPGVIYLPIEGETLTYSAVWLPHNDNPALRRLLSMARDLAGNNRG